MSTPLNFQQQLTGCFGQPVSENPTQAMMEAAYAHHDLDWRYLTIEVAPEDLEDAVTGAKAMGFIGFNCTIPHKINVIQHLDALGKSASVMQAVNCVTRRDGKWVGENTDGKGFIEGLRPHIDPKGKSVVVFGAGGASRAIAVEVALAGAAQITIVNRSIDRGENLVGLLKQRLPTACTFSPWEGDYQIPPNTDIVVNATSIGLYPDVAARLALDTHTLLPNMVVADVIPNPPQTQLVRDARSRGCQVIDGLAMLVNQGAIGMEYWSGVTPDRAVMRQALENIFSS